MPENSDLFAALDKRLTELEHWRIQMTTRYEEQRKHFDRRFDELDQKIGGVNDTLKWATRTVFGAILLAVVAFLVKGGFNLG